MRGIDSYLAAHGISFEKLLAKNGMENVNFDTMSSYVSLSRFADLLAHASDQLNDDQFALKASVAHPAEGLSASALCSTYAPTIEEAIRSFVDYAPVYIDLAALRLVETAGEAAIELRLPSIIAHKDQLSDRLVVNAVNRLRAHLGEDWKPERVDLQRKVPADQSLYRRHICKDCRFDSPANFIRFKPDTLLRTNPYHDAELYEALAELNKRLLSERRKVSGTIQRVIEEITAKLPQGDYSIISVAKLCNMSVRGLQRHLSESGTSFVEIVDETKKEISINYIRNTKLSISEISYLTGFSTVGNFTRATKRWFGFSPTELRRNKM
ncbi:MAG: AraC family transcriptional regulator ligand-binding domain-containing protein [Stappiaceae bacterium]